MRSIIAFVLLATATPVSAQTFTTLASFKGPDGTPPYLGSLVQGKNGNLYGTALQGGNKSNSGTVFEASLTGQIVPLYKFCSQPNCADGADPNSSLVLASSGNFYGTTQLDGAYRSHGTVFKVAVSGTLTTVHSFCQSLTSRGYCTDGSNPTSPLVEATNGDLYGEAPIGGDSDGGTIFAMTPAGDFHTIYQFCLQVGCLDGVDPTGGLMQASNGNFYGVAGAGGSGNGGTVFQITPEGAFTSLYSFCNQTNHGVCRDGDQPNTALVQATDGNLYGTTMQGGVFTKNCTYASSCGTVFLIAPTGAFSTLYTFCVQSNCPDGKAPTGTLIQASDGNLYGTASAGGAMQSGTVFKLTPQGVLTVLHSFCTQPPQCADGLGPVGGLVQASNGVLYGTTVRGGAYNQGTIYSLTLSYSSSH